MELVLEYIEGGRPSSNITAAECGMDQSNPP